MTLKIVLTGQPGSGKSTLLYILTKYDFFCFNEVARDLIEEYSLRNINILDDMTLFQKKIIQRSKSREERIKDKELVFYDRSDIDSIAYKHMVDEPITDLMQNIIDRELNKQTLNLVFHLEGDESYYKQQDQKEFKRRYNYEESHKLGTLMFNVYKDLNYNPITLDVNEPYIRVHKMMSKIKEFDLSNELQNKINTVLELDSNTVKQLNKEAKASTTYI